MPESKFFETNIYYVDEASTPLNFGDWYTVYNDKNARLGTIKETVSTGQKIARSLLGKQTLPFRFEIKDSSNVLLASMWRELKDDRIIYVSDGDESIICSIHYMNMWKSGPVDFKIYDHEMTQIADVSRISGSNFHSINDMSGVRIATILNRFTDPIREIFTTADNYYIGMEPSYADNDKFKIIVLTATVTLDLIPGERS